MNIDLKTELLRFLVPPSIFWSALILSSNINQSININQFFTCNNILLQSPWWMFSFIFISTGFIISAIVAHITYWVDECKKPVWRTPEGELKYWVKVSCGGDYFSKKIEANWHFYYLNLNSALALLLALLVMFYEHSMNYGLIIFIIIVIILFICLAVKNYKRAKEFGDIINKESQQNS